MNVLKRYFMLFSSELLRFIPLEIAIPIAKFLGFLWYILTPRRREAIRENMRHIKGKFTEKDIRKLFINYAVDFVYFLKVPVMGKNEILSLIRTEGEEYIRENLKRGVILVSAHLCNWEIMGSYFALKGYKLNAVAEMRGPGEGMFRFYKRYRGRFGVNILPLEERKTWIRIKEALKNGEIVALVSDRDLSGTGIILPFFDSRASFPKGPAYFSIKTGSPIVCGFVRREEGRYTGYAHPPLEPEGETMESLTQKIVKILEQEIGKYPEYWYVFQPVWK